jgi:hypothetical protein
MDLGRFGEAWDALGKEIADEAHRFGAALRDYGKLFYDMHVADVEGALARTPYVIEEAKALARAWMLTGLSNRLALASPSQVGDTATIARIEALIADTGMFPGMTGTTALALAKGDTTTARTSLKAAESANQGQLAVVARLTRVQLLAQIETADGNHQAANDAISTAVALAREKSMRSQLWRLLGEQAIISEKTGEAQAASASKAEAKQIMAELSQTIPDERQRANFLQGRVATQLGLA